MRRGGWYVFAGAVALAWFVRFILNGGSKALGL